MNILIYGNIDEYRFNQEFKIACEFAKTGNDIYFVCNYRPSKIFNEDISNYSNLHLIIIAHNEYLYDYLSLNVHIDVCLGIDQSVVSFVADFKRKTNVLSYCFFSDFPLSIIDGTDPLTYNVDYSQKFYYWLNCALEINTVIFGSKFARDQFYKVYKKDVEVVYWSVIDENIFDQINVEPPTNDYLFGCGSISRLKGNELVLFAIEDQPYSYQHVFTSYEKFYLDTFKLLANIISNRVVLHLKASEEEKFRLVYNSKIVMYPQLTQWLGGTPIIEGMSVKTPGICFDYPIMREMYGDSVLYAKPRDRYDLRKNIQLLYEDDGLYKEKSEIGYELFKEKFTIRNTVKGFLDIMGVKSEN